MDGGPWKEIASGLPASDGQWAWTLPREPGAVRVMRLRVIGRLGNQIFQDQSREDFIVESRIPRVELKGPPVSRLVNTTVHFRILAPETSPSEGKKIAPPPLKRIRCYVRREGEEKWFLAGERRLRLPAGISESMMEQHPILRLPPEVMEGSLSIFIEDGKYEIFLVPEDAVGNHPDLPLPGEVDPARLFLVDTVPPRLMISLENQKDIFESGEVAAYHIRVEDENLSELSHPHRYRPGAGRGFQVDHSQALFPPKPDLLLPDAP